MVYLLSGYKTLSVVQLVNLFSVVIDNLALFDAFRLLLGYLSLEAKQEATKRSLKKQGHPVSDWQGPSLAELRSVVPGRKSISRLWESLEATGAITRTGKMIHITETPLPIAQAYLGLVCGLDKHGNYRRSITRPVPIPREWLAIWAQPTRGKLVTLLHLFYCAACLSFKNKQSGEVKLAATFKFRQLVAFTGLHRSRLTGARRVLIKEERISPDETIYQRKLNRDGHHASVNLDWRRSRERSRQQEEPHETGPPPSEKCTLSGPPIRDKKQSSIVIRNQKPTGVRIEPVAGPPTSANIQASDLGSIDRLRVLFAKQTWLGSTKPEFLFFVAAAVKAREAGVFPEKLFAWLVRGRKLGFVTQAHEDTALKEIKLWELKSGMPCLIRPQRKKAPKSAPKAAPEVAVEERLRVRRLIAKSFVCGQ